MRALLFGLAALATVPANIQPAVAQQGCQYQGALARAGDRYVSTSLRVPRDGRCSHAVGGTAGGVQIVTPPQHGRVEVSSGGVVYVPQAGYVGPDAYAFSVRREAGATQVNVSVQVE